MGELDKLKYDSNLKEYSHIIRMNIKDKERILKCLQMFEYFEDYEKCKDLISILRKIEDKESINHL